MKVGFYGAGAAAALVFKTSDALSLKSMSPFDSWMLEKPKPQTLMMQLGTYGL